MTPGSRFAALAHALEHLLPAQAPLADFVHHNTLHGFQHLPFREALAAAGALHRQATTLPETEWQAIFAGGRIDADDLAAVLAEEPPPAAYACPPGLDDGALRAALVRLPAVPGDAAALAWAMAEAGRPAADDPLWRDCIAFSRAPEDAPPEAPAAPEDAIASAGRVLCDALQARFGRADGTTWGELLRELTGFDPLADLRAPLVRLLAGGLDRGLAAWPLPDASRGLYAAWRAGLGAGPQAPADEREDLGGRIDDPTLAALLPESAEAAIAFVLERYALPEARWDDYLTRLALRLPGWFGMLLRHECAGAGALRLIDGLAVLLALEYAAVSRHAYARWSLRPRIDMLVWYFREHPAELLVRQALHAPADGRPLPETLAAQAGRLIASVDNPAEADGPEWIALAAEILADRAATARRDADVTVAWPLWQLAGVLGLRTLDAALAGGLLAAHRAFSAETRHWLRLLAYERHYRDRILGALAANRGRREAAAPAAPSAQVVFCMDDREEGMRRHLEEVDPTVATFGVAGFFGLPIRWRGFAEPVETALCPVVVTPAHRVREQPIDAAAGERRRRRRAWRARWRTLLHHESRNGALAAFLTPLAGLPATLLALAGKVLAPGLTGRLAAGGAARFDGPLETGLAACAAPDPAPASPAAPREGFTDDEQVERVAATLRTIGLVRDFAPLVVILGHGSHSLNNPHRSAYDCGACGGKHGGPNARAFALFANRPEVRLRLAGRGIDIPPTTVFVGAQHDTCDDGLAVFDEPRLPASHRAPLTAFRAAWRTAAGRHAIERCRRFASAPERPTPEAARRHVATRGTDFAQARPELGHVTNACAVIGRRTLTRGAFLDRRSFLISYDPTLDEGGRILEAILLAAGPVGAGICLEYYFSTVNNEGWGCGSKVMHNLCGEVGVMEGSASDLRTGLPRQMIEIHEAMRLLVVCEATPETLSAIVARQPALTELVGRGWIIVAAVSPGDGAMQVFDPQRGWSRWTMRAGLEPARAAGSLAWIVDDTGRLRRDALPPALIDRPEGRETPREKKAGAPPPAGAARRAGESS